MDHWLPLDNFWFWVVVGLIGGYAIGEFIKWRCLK